MMKAFRADISAVLIIAFLFQFITPVVVLAGDNTELSEFEIAMRDSICRVDIGDEASGQPSHTDRFVCDFCVLCQSDATKDLDFLLPEVSSIDFIDASPQPSEAIEHVAVALSRYGRPQTPRAPPFK